MTDPNHAQCELADSDDLAGEGALAAITLVGLPALCPPGRTSLGLMVWRRRFPGRADQIASARGLVRQLLADTACADDAAWVTGELSTNAVVHSRSGRTGGFVLVEVTRCPHVARVAVYDLGGGGTPRVREQRPGTPTRERGYGLYGVRLLSVRSGVSGDSINGHVVWAQLALSPGQHA